MRRDRAPRRLQFGVHVPDHRIDLTLGEEAPLDHDPRELLPNARVPEDPTVHHGLRVGRFVPLVVAVATVAHEVDDDVLPELEPVVDGEPHGRHAGLGVVGVDVHDREPEAQGQVARVAGRTALAGESREAELVVRDDVEGAAGLVGGEPAQVQRLGDHALAREGGVTVDEDGEDGRGVSGLAGEARRARHAEHDRIHVFEMARIGGQPHVELDFVLGDLRPASDVILHVTGPVLREGGHDPARGLLLELRHDRLVGEAHDVGQHVEAAAVRHPEEQPAARRAGRPRR